MLLRANERTEVHCNLSRWRWMPMEICKSKREESLQKKRRKGLQATHQQSFSSSLHASATTTVKKKGFIV
ncbi:hypothetical protein SO802_011120 [Lithocarpus litseifolius]|uniref:Uncharacterized protein n=1 Tax=Lithocarpus litseifolius TaxID=425828 RepID=A0AAW2DG54_9ROSI